MTPEQITLGNLNTLVSDCQQFVKGLARFRFVETDEPAIIALEVSAKGDRWYDGNLTVVVDTVRIVKVGRGSRRHVSAKPKFHVERVTPINGTRLDPPDVSIGVVASFDTLFEAFSCVMTEWFKEGIELAVSNAAEARMFADAG